MPDGIQITDAERELLNKLAEVDKNTAVLAEQSRTVHAKIDTVLEQQKHSVTKDEFHTAMSNVDRRFDEHARRIDEKADTDATRKDIANIWKVLGVAGTIFLGLVLATYSGVLDTLLSGT